jgi:hypothetical protein
MSRTVAVVWHASFSIAAGVGYFFFVLPRWPELLGDTSHTLGTTLRIVTGALIGLAALPVVFTLLRTRRPEFGTPQLALTLRTSSIALHVLAGCADHRHRDQRDLVQRRQRGSVAVRHLRRRRRYRAARHLRVLPGLCGRAAAASAQATQAQKGQTGPPRSRKAAEEAADEAPEADEVTTEDETEDSSESDEKPAEVTAETAEPESTADEPEPTAQEEPAVEDEVSDEAPSTNGRLRNRRRRRLRGGVAVED